jgi:hypothetical protein
MHESIVAFHLVEKEICLLLHHFYDASLKGMGNIRYVNSNAIAPGIVELVTSSQKSQSLHSSFDKSTVEEKSNI